MHRIDAGKEYMEGEKHLASEGMETLSKKHRIISVPVSYTHLTLPTIA